MKGISHSKPELRFRLQADLGHQMWWWPLILHSPKTPDTYCRRPRCPISSSRSGCLGKREKPFTVHILAQALKANKAFSSFSFRPELTVIGPVSRASQGLGKAFYRAAVAYCDSQNQRPKVPPASLSEGASKWSEKTLQFSWYSADSNHTASPTITCCSQNCYRLSRPFLFDNCYHQKHMNRSV